MRKSLLYVLIALFAVAFSSCGNNEEIYNPRTCKLYKIWEKSEVGDPYQIFTYEKNQLINIDEFDALDSVHYQYDFVYNKDKTVKEILHETENYTERIELFYANKQVCRMVYYMEDTSRTELLFKRDAETQKITQVVEYYDFGYHHQYEAVHKSAFFNRFIGFTPTIEDHLVGSKGDFIMRCVRDVVYDEEEENILSITETYPEYAEVVKYTYTYNIEEDNFNPYYGLPYVYKGLLGFSKYNKLTEYVVKTTYGNVTFEENIAYTYELNAKGYPREIIKLSSLNFVPMHTYILYVSE